MTSSFRSATACSVSAAKLVPCGSSSCKKKRTLSRKSFAQQVISVWNVGKYEKLTMITLNCFTSFGLFISRSDSVFLIFKRNWFLKSELRIVFYT